MWKDEKDNMLDILDEIEKGQAKFPTVCPVCGKQEAHLYMHKESGENIGGLWVWCSSCKNYIHATYQIPQWWKNSLEITESELSPNPQYLEENKDVLDMWVQKLHKQKQIDLDHSSWNKWFCGFSISFR